MTIASRAEPDGCLTIMRPCAVGADLGARPHVSLGSASSRALAIGASRPSGRIIGLSGGRRAGFPDSFGALAGR